jgi:hypothetical protein
MRNCSQTGSKTASLECAVLSQFATVNFQVLRKTGSRVSSFCAGNGKIPAPLDNGGIRLFFATMNRVLAACIFLVVGVSLVCSQEAAQSGKALGQGVASGSSTNKPDIKELMKGDVFTNASEIVIVKAGAVWVSKFPITQEQYRKITGASPSQFSGDNNPVDSVSYNDARSFCTQLDEAERKEEMLPAGYTYTLPTQSQWESLMEGATLDQAVTSLNSPRSGTAPTGSLAPNGLGLYDIRGNVWQFCLDPEDKPYRVLRGGAWDTSIEINARPEFRWYAAGPDEKKNIFGFRVVLIAK